MDAQIVGYRPIERALAMGRVTDHWMRNVFQVSSDLVSAPGEGLDLQLGMADFRVAPMSHRQRAQAQHPKNCPRRQALRPGGAPVVFHPRERVIDQQVGARPAPHDGTIGFSDARASSKARSEHACGFGIESEREDSAGRLVEPVQRIDGLTKLLAQRLEHHTRFSAVERSRVYQPARWFADDGEPLIPVEQGEGWVDGRRSMSVRQNGPASGCRARSCAALQKRHHQVIESARAFVVGKVARTFEELAAAGGKQAGHLA